MCLPKLATRAPISSFCLRLFSIYSSRALTVTLAGSQWYDHSMFPVSLSVDASGLFSQPLDFCCRPSLCALNPNPILHRFLPYCRTTVCQHQQNCVRFICHLTMFRNSQTELLQEYARATEALRRLQKMQLQGPPSDLLLSNAVSPSSAPSVSSRTAVISVSSPADTALLGTEDAAAVAGQILAVVKQICGPTLFLPSFRENDLDSLPGAESTASAAGTNSAARTLRLPDTFSSLLPSSTLPFTDSGLCVPPGEHDSLQSSHTMMERALLRDAVLRYVQASAPNPVLTESESLMAKGTTVSAAQSAAAVEREDDRDRGRLRTFVDCLPFSSLPPTVAISRRTLPYCRHSRRAALEISPFISRKDMRSAPFASAPKTAVNCSVYAAASVSVRNSGRSRINCTRESDSGIDARRS